MAGSCPPASPPPPVTAASDDCAELKRYRRAFEWLERRGRVKARQFGDMKDNWKWDVRDGPLLDAVEAAMGSGTLSD
jgi:hypothetical protein